MSDASDAIAKFRETGEVWVAFAKYPGFRYSGYAEESFDFSLPFDVSGGRYEKRLVRDLTLVKWSLSLFEVAEPVGSDEEFLALMRRMAGASGASAYREGDFRAHAAGRGMFLRPAIVMASEELRTVDMFQVGNPMTIYADSFSWDGSIYDTRTLQYMLRECAASSSSASGRGARRSQFHGWDYHYSVLAPNNSNLEAAFAPTRCFGYSPKCLISGIVSKELFFMKEAEAAAARALSDAKARRERIESSLPELELRIECTGR